MNKFDQERLFVALENNIEKAKHIAENIIENYELDKDNVDGTDNASFAMNRYNIWIELEILVDYISSIKENSKAIEKAVGA